MLFKVTQIIFAVLEDWYHHIVLTHSCKLVSFLRIYLLFYCQKSGNEPNACKKRYSTTRIFTFYLFKAEQYTSSRVQNVGCVYYCCCSYYAAARCIWKSRLAVVDFDWRHLIAKPSIRTSVRCKDLGDIYCTSRGITHFVLNFVAMATRVSRGKIQLAAFDGPFPKTSQQMQKISQTSFTQVIANFVPNFVAMATGVGRGKCGWQHSMAHPRNHPISAKISKISKIAKSRRYLSHKPSYSQFLSEIS